MVIYYLSKSQAVSYHFMVLYSETVNEGITLFFLIAGILPGKLLLTLQDQMQMALLRRRLPDSYTERRTTSVFSPSLSTHYCSMRWVTHHFHICLR